MKHLNPRQGITTQSALAWFVRRNIRVKHLNPRQGITTAHRARWLRLRGQCRSVKHLNPRQGITTADDAGAHTPTTGCETPESPPGDYNGLWRTSVRWRERTSCETPESPPGDYNQYRHSSKPQATASGVKHLNPRQGITTQVEFLPRTPDADNCRVKHLNPRQGITTNAPHVGTRLTIPRMCETPESPPGDYNSASADARFSSGRRSV